MGSCRLRKGPYLGDVSAVCLISSPHRRLLLAGTGPHVLLYDILKGSLLSSVVAFDGIRVHGICCGPDIKDKMHPTSSRDETRLPIVLVHGERRVRVFKMVFINSGEDPHLKLWQSLPRFSHWVMDVRLLLQIPHAGGAEVMLLAVGLSNNTICLWDLSNLVILYRVECSDPHTLATLPDIAALDVLVKGLIIPPKDSLMPERLLLYSMRLWGDSPVTLHAGVGTIFNEVLVWKLGPHVAAVQDVSRRLTLLKREIQGGEQLLGEVYKHRSTEPVFAIEEVVEPLQKLLGHEGSVYRLTWSADGLTLVSVSDDRSARVWHSGGKEGLSCSQWVAPAKVGPVLYGHAARLWDCHVSEKLLITASEDCTCRIWTTDGKCLATLKGHQGRGIWRCVYDPDLNIVVTAGADSSIKIQALDKWSERIETAVFDQHTDSTARGSQSKQEVFSIDPVWSGALAKGSGYLNSKSEYVRCLRLSDNCSLYVGTNQGYLYHVQVSQNQEPSSWTTLVNSLGAPVVCMDVLVSRKGNGDLRGVGNHPSEDMVVVGDGKGNVTAIRVKNGSQKQCVWRYTWAAEKERQLLEVFWCRPLKGRYVFTADPKGTFLTWRLPSSDIKHGSCTKNCCSCLSATEDTKVAVNETEESAVLVALGKCAYGRIVCMDVCLNQELLVFGDKQGSLTVFFFPKILHDHAGDVEKLLQSRRGASFQLQIVAVLKGAHGISTVTTVTFVSKQHGGQAEIHTTGRDGCVCRFQLESHPAATTTPQSLTCTGIEKVPAVSMLECLEHTTDASSWTNSERKVAVGFTGSDFLLWDTTHNSELLRVTCGGWRRPFSYIIGKMPDIQHAFVFVKDQAIQVHRNWVNSSEAAVSKGESDIATRSLRCQFHGREINSVLILASPRITGCEIAGNQNVTIATGAEDGTVILSSYLEDMQEQLDPTLVLKDHVGGSAVRCLTLVEEAHTLGRLLDADAGLRVNKDFSSEGAVQSCDSGHFLFSAGAKEVLTCWRLDWITKSLDFQGSYVGKEVTGQLPPLADEKLEGPMVPTSFKVSSQWLSTRMLPRKRPPTSVSGENDLAESAKLSSLVTRLANEEDDLKDDRIAVSKIDDDDCRYLAMTAFAVTCTQTGILVCFVVTASSNATLSVHAFHVATRSWIEVATLDYQDAPVLTIEHIVAPCSSTWSDSAGHHNAFVVLTGGTNGNIALWDVTSTVVQYMKSGGPSVEGAVPSVLRPVTGRGSQGGRRRKTREELKLAKKSKAKPARKPEEYNVNLDSDPVKQVSDSGGDISTKSTDMLNPCHPSNSSDRQYAVEEQSHDRKVVVERSPSIPVLSFLQEIEAAHQSGVNCMSVARLQFSSEGYSSNAEMVYIVISGGDDQAIHLTTIKLVAQKCSSTTTTKAEDFQGKNKPQDRREPGEQTSSFMKCLSRSTISCAHSSAVRGIWTDGSWVFSIGLDQRLRCWKITPELCIELDDSTLDHSKGLKCGSPLVECVTCVIDTPEAASLHVSTNSPGKYRIAVVGRGLQVINFDSSLTQS